MTDRQFAQTMRLEMTAGYYVEACLKLYANSESDRAEQRRIATELGEIVKCAAEAGLVGGLAESVKDDVVNTLPSEPAGVGMDDIRNLLARLAAAAAMAEGSDIATDFERETVAEMADTRIDWRVVLVQDARAMIERLNR